MRLISGSLDPESISALAAIFDSRSPLVSLNTFNRFVTRMTDNFGSNL